MSADSKKQLQASEHMHSVGNSLLTFQQAAGPQQTGRSGGKMEG